MAPQQAAALLLAAYCGAPSVSASETTPVEKVTQLLTDLKAGVVAEGTAEAAAYDEFACFCKDTTNSKSESVKLAQDEIDTLSADIQSDTAEQADKQSRLLKRKESAEELTAKLSSETIRCQKEAAEYDAKVMDLSKALSSLEKAVQSMEDAKPSSSSLLTLQKTLSDSLGLADALSLIKAPKQKAIQAFLQSKVDPDKAEYEMHSKGIIKTLESLETTFTEQKKSIEDERDKAKTACEELKQGLNDELSTNEDAMRTLGEDIDMLTTQVADNRGKLVTTQTGLSDDQEYLKDITQRCEKKARTWDQRSQLRAKEIEALTQAMEIISGKVTDSDSVNQRALLLRQSNASVKIGQVNSSSSLQPEKKKAKLAKDARPVPKAASMTHGVKALLSISEHSHSAREAGAYQLLHDMAGRLNSPVLSAIAEKVMSNPFSKVKGLIQGLIERLLKEATEEATKKGFCDTELGKAKHTRDARYADSTKITAEIGALKAKKDELEQAVTTLSESVQELNSALEEATTVRGEEKEANLAIGLLKTFYKEAGKAKVLLQASPVDEDAPASGFSGAYSGNQQASSGIVGLLEVIRSDFERTVHSTETDEKAAQEDHVKFQRVSKSDIAAKSTAIELSEQDLQTTKNGIESKTSDLQSNQELLDMALRGIADLKPMCIDNGMSYAERVEAREQETAALKKALCLLDPEKVESECQ
jgi:hypothetical protein